MSHFEYNYSHFLLISNLIALFSFKNVANQQSQVEILYAKKLGYTNKLPKVLHSQFSPAKSD